MVKVKAAFRAAMKLDAKQGEQKLEQLARWLERDHPSASGRSLASPARFALTRTTSRRVLIRDA